MRSILLFFLIIIVQQSFAQLSTEKFEDETSNSTTFSDQGVTFSISSSGNGFKINNFPGLGWDDNNGSSGFADNKFIDNPINGNFTVTISTQNNSLFLLKSMYLYIDGSNVNSGSITITGKRAGGQVFSETIGSGINTNININNGYTLINLATLNGRDNSFRLIDQFVITNNGNPNIDYLALDAMKWYKYNSLAATTASTNVSCNGGSNGTATISSVTGGLAPYSYSWSPYGGTSQMATSLLPGTYTCNITDALGEYITKNVTITQPSAISGTITSTNVSCNGGLNGTATISVSGGASGYTYSWSPGLGTTATRTGLAAGTYTCTVTDANSCTITRSVTITQPSALSGTISSTNVSCNGGSNGIATISVSGGASGYTYLWSPGLATTAARTGLTAGTYTCTVTDANNCTITNSVTITQPSALVISNITNSPICLGDAITISASSDATQVDWKLAGNTVSTNTNLTTVNSSKQASYTPSQVGIYSAVVSSAAGCTTISTNVVVNSTPIANSGATIVGNLSTGIYLKNGCLDLIALIKPAGANPVSGVVTATVWIEQTQPSTIGEQYVKRHYEINPSNNANTATGRITLYFTQAEFNDFNAVSTIDLPTGSGDVIGISNLLIEKRTGVSNNGTGVPSSYTSTITTIDPLDSDIIWNATDNRWEVSFDVSGFSGFFVKSSNTTLPVTWISFSGNRVNEIRTVLNWKVEESNVASYTIESSTDGIQFVDIGTMASKGNGINNYQFIENKIFGTARFYRVKQIDLDGRYSYSSILKISSIESSQVLVYPVPFKESISIFSPIYQKVILYNIQGQIVKSIELNKGINTVATDMLHVGTYLLKLENGNLKKIIKN